MWESGYYGYLSDYLWWWIALVSLVIHTWCVIRLWPKDHARRLRLITGNILITLTLLTAVGLVGETYFRFFSYATDSTNATLTSDRWFAAYSIENSLNFRDEEWSEEKPPGVYRIAFIGDSFTYGWGINDPADRFTDIIQSKFYSAGATNIHVMNMAWRGWATENHVGAVEHVAIPHQVDEIVLCYLLNDIETIVPVPEGYDPFHPGKATYVNISSSFLINRLYYTFLYPRTKSSTQYLDWLGNGVDNPAVWQKHLDMLDDIIVLCRQNRMRLRVVLMPFPETPQSRLITERVHRRLSQFFKTKEVPVLDLFPFVADRDPRELSVNAQDWHPNEKAHSLFAQAIWNAFYAQIPPNAVEPTSPIVQP